MTRIEKAMLQLKADLEELKEYSDKSGYEYNATRKTSDKILESLTSKSVPIEEFDFNTVSVMFEEQQKIFREMLQNEIRVITRVSPKLEPFFEDLFSGFEKEHQDLMNQFQVLKENPTYEKFLEWFKKVLSRTYEPWLIHDIMISKQIIEDILKRLEGD